MEQQTVSRGARIYALLRPSPTLPRVIWSAARPTWRPRALTFLVLLAGLTLFGIGEGALIAANLGNTPWTVLAQGVARRTPLDIGFATIAISLIVLLGWIPLRQRPGLGTVMNVLVIGLALDGAARWLPHPHDLFVQIAQALAGIAIVGVGSAFYLTANLGPGPRDGWMTGLHRVSGVGIAWVRTTVEVVVLVIGALLGGHVGVATVAFAVLVGYVLAATLRALPARRA